MLATQDGGRKKEALSLSNLLVRYNITKQSLFFIFYILIQIGLLILSTKSEFLPIFLAHIY